MRCDHLFPNGGRCEKEATEPDWIGIIPTNLCYLHLLELDKKKRRISIELDKIVSMRGNDNAEA